MQLAALLSRGCLHRKPALSRWTSEIVSTQLGKDFGRYQFLLAGYRGRLLELSCEFE
jgi:hypothetical protein